MVMSQPVLRVLGDVLDAEKKLLALKAMADDVTGKPYDITILANDAEIKGVFADTVVKFQALQKAIEADPLKIPVDDLGAQATFAKLAIEWKAIKDLMNKGLTTGLSDNQVLSMAAAVTTLDSRIDGLRGSLRGAAAEAEALALAEKLIFKDGMMASTGGRYGLGGKVNLFGGASFLPDFMSQISVWHLAADAGLEVLAVWIPALVALGAAAIGAAPVIADVYKQLSNVNVVAQATGDKVGFMNGAVTGSVGAYQKLQNEMKPGVIEVFGDALDVLSKKSGVFSQLALGAEHVVEVFAAQASIALQSGAGTGFLKNGVDDLTKLTQSFQYLGRDIGDVLRQMPGVANVLLDIGNGALQATGGVLHFLGPLLKLALAAHGAIIWGGLIFTALLQLRGPLVSVAEGFVKLYVAMRATMIAGGEGGIVGTFGTMATGALGLIVIFAAVAAAVYSADKAATSFNTNIQNSLGKSSIKGLTGSLQQAIAQSAAYDASIQKGFNSTANPLGQTSGFGYIGSLIEAATGGDTPALLDLKGANSGLSQFDQESINTKANLATLAQHFGGLANAEGLATSAGVSSTQIMGKGANNMAVMIQMMRGYISGLAGMGQSTGMIGNDLAVMGKQSTDAYTNMQKLNSAWDQQTTDVTAARNAFDTYDQGLTTLRASGDALTLHLGMLTDRTVQGKAAIDGLTTSDIALNQAFQSQVTNGNAVLDTLRSAGISANVFKGAVGDIIAPLERYAKGSSSATAELVALGEEAGYTGPASLERLNQYLGITSKSGMAGLEKAAEAATTQEALLSGAMAAQGNFIATQYTSDLQKAELGLDGLSQKLKTYAQYQARGTTDTQAGQKALGQLVLALEVSGAHLGSTTGQVDALITSMLHIPKSKIIQITVQLALSGNLAAYDLLQQEGLGGTIRAQLPGSNSGPGKHGATGMLVPSGFSHDNFPAYLQSGEAVVPAHLTPYVAPFLKAHGVPGFASGWVPPRMSSYTGIGGGGDTHFHINVNGDSDPHGAAKVIIQKVRAYKAVTGNQATGIG